MNDLIKVMGTLVDTDGKILIPGILDDVPFVTDEERKTYESIEFDLVSFFVFKF